jgi:hypothetical protein
MSTARLAGFATRALALSLDGALLAAGAVLIGAGVALAAKVVGVHFASGDPLVAALAGVGWIILVSAYLVTFWRLTGQTPGMRFMGLRVIDRSGAPLGSLQSVRRLGIRCRRRTRRRRPLTTLNGLSSSVATAALPSAVTRSVPSASARMRYASARRAGTTTPGPHSAARAP